jgi:hypothetical protein
MENERAIAGTLPPVGNRALSSLNAVGDSDLFQSLFQDATGWLMNSDQRAPDLSLSCVRSLD